MALTLPVTGRFKADGNDIPQHRADSQELYCTGMANHHADISVWRDHSQVMGQPPKSRHAQFAVQQHQRHEHFRNSQRIQQRQGLGR